ncbi:hypothetical protein [Actinokineospora diospyrosa]|uniref:hypothetical protein n=1 Tax=Actinokineospora diospyrosa TaxID=103728 RepID=UPI0020A2F552|nr:hypothetical protein [Actinokineospora diospyrosa]
MRADELGGLVLGGVDGLEELGGRLGGVRAAALGSGTAVQPGVGAAVDGWCGTGRLGTGWGLSSGEGATATGGANWATAERRARVGARELSVGTWTITGWLRAGRRALGRPITARGAYAIGWAITARNACVGARAICTRGLRVGERTIVGWLRAGEADLGISRRPVA